MFTIGNVAARVGINTSAIRYYERHGILQPALRAANGYRFYDADAVRTLVFVKRAQSLGITLKEMKPLLNLAAHGQRPCSYVKRVARRHLNEVSKKISELELLRKDLRMLLTRRVGRRDETALCPLIEKHSVRLPEH
ncbi:MAG TPA: MerR family DNA-binding protein [Candidatus Polarisedimenticolaceae bacterium]|nr:MerR family DNA-binding protein [Candidatus Polarisedimenticolaceae bacterium]